VFAIMENRSPGGGEAAAAVPDVVPDAPQNPPPEAMETDSLATATESPAPAPDALPSVVDVQPVAAAAAVPAQEVQNDVDVEMSEVVDMTSTVTGEEPKEPSTVPEPNLNAVPPQEVSTNQEQSFPAAQEPHIKNELLSLNVSTSTPPPIRNTTPPPLSNANVAEFSTPPQPANRDLRNIILAAAASTAQSQGMFRQGPVPPSPIVEPGALHELGDIGTPGRRRSSAVGGIAGLEELRNREAAESEQNRFDQLIQATKLNGDEDPTPVVDAFLRLDFEDGNVYYIRNRSVVFGRAEGTAAGYYSQVGPDGSTIIETGPRGFGRSTSSGLTSMKREKKKRKKKKDEHGLMGKTKSTTSDSATPAPSRRGSVFAQPPRLRDPFGLADMDEEVDEPVIHLPLSNASIDGAPMPLRKNISRRHARLYYNPPKRRFELEIMGKNGAFVNEEYVQAGTTIVVEENGMKVQIGGISFTVITPEILVEPEPEEEFVPPPPPKFTGGKGKMSFAFHDENGDEVNYSDEDEEMEDAEIGSGGEGSVEPDSGPQESDEDDQDQDEGGSGEDADEEDDQEDSSDEDEIDASSPESTKPARPRPMKSIVDIKRREEELKRDRNRIKELQRQLKEKEREKAEAEAEVLRQQRAQMRAQEREQELEKEREMKRAQEREREKKRERERQRELAREREKEKLKEDKRNKKAMEKAMEIARQKELRQKEKELLRAAKEREKERQREAQREAKRQQKLHLPQPAGSVPPKKEAKLILPTISSNSTPMHSQSPAPAGRPQPTLLLPQPSSTDTIQIQQLPLPPQQQQPLPQIDPAMDFSQQDHLYQDSYQQPPAMHHIQHPQPLQPMPMPQIYATSASTIDPALYQTGSPHIMPPTMHHDPNMMAPYHHQPIVEKPRKEKPPPKPRKLRTPSPEINEADLPPESLIKPNISYVVMIHEAIMNSAEKVLSLPQIYKAIEAKYPYYKFKVTTQGWQSSVRHNLGQHKAFYKVDRAGKGWLWGIVDGVSIEKEKKGSSSKQAMSAHDMHGQAMQNGQMMGHMGQLQPGFQQQVYQGAGMQMMHPPVQQIPPPPSYMPAKPLVQPHAAVPQNPRAMEAPIPMPPVANGTPDMYDTKSIIAVLTRIIAQRQSQVSSDPNAHKTLAQLKNFLDQMSSGTAAPGAMEAVQKILKNSPKPPALASPPVPTPPFASLAPPPSSQMASSPPPPPQYATPVSAPAPQPVALAPPVLAPAPPTQGQVGAKAPSQPPSQAPTITLANLGQHIKSMSAEERARWTKKLLEIKQQKAAAASGGAPPAPAPVSVSVAAPVAAPVPAPVPAPVSAPVSAPVAAPVAAPVPAASIPAPPPHPETAIQAPHPTTGGKAPVPSGKYPATAGKAPMGLGAGKRPAGKMPLKAPLAEAIRNVPRELKEQVKEQVVAKVKANQALKRPLDSSDGVGGSGVTDAGEPPVKRVDVGAGKE
jgi:pSer/pThr/pTyr-binding forkhead associated (FHA) protein